MVHDCSVKMSSHLLVLFYSFSMDVNDRYRNVLKLYIEAETSDVTTKHPNFVFYYHGRCFGSLSEVERLRLFDVEVPTSKLTALISNCKALTYS